MQKNKLIWARPEVLQVVIDEAKAARVAGSRPVDEFE